MLLILFSFGVTGCDYIEIDKCLDNSGKWDYENKKCIYEEILAEDDVE